MAAISTMITSAAQGNGNVKSGLTLLMPCFSAVYIGFAVFKKPSVIGTFLGAVFTAMIQNGFTLMSVPFYYSDMVVSGLLILAILFSRFELSSQLARRPKQQKEGR
jgi:simple sugar transport system permease protein/ribose transport system permease protein